MGKVGWSYQSGLPDLRRLASGGSSQKTLRHLGLAQVLGFGRLPAGQIFWHRLQSHPLIRTLGIVVVSKAVL